ncbi:MAG TPA: trypsin-like peptidase domain-containing protein [Thermoanaerobaculia bacterium]|nr:trypsin-like peptidase domain-containing protein [Thermoanaerobaculia bacterium]
MDETTESRAAMTSRHPAAALTLTLALVAPLVAAPAVGQPPRAGDVRRTPVVEVVERVSPAVVNISAESMVRQPDPFFGGFFSRRRPSTSLGSGLIVAGNGIVVTNAHVIEGASRITVITLDGRELPADVLGSDRDTDLAVLEVEATGLPAVPLGTSSDLLIGETVVAIGNPFGLSHTVTSGTLSARGRALPGSARGGETRFTDFLQTDASINPGNSGGPLVNLAGDVIGINTAIISGANGIGFAIPADRARRVVSDLLRHGELQPLWTGLRLLTLDPALVREYDLAVERGALVYRVYPDSPGADAGFAEGDVIVTVAGRPVQAREDVTTALYSAEAGGAVPLEVRRGERRRSLSLTAGQPPQGLGVELLERAVGLVVGERNGQLVVQRVVPGSPAAERGLAAGDVVLAANGQRAADLVHLGREVLRALDRGGLLLVVQRGRFAYNLSFPL